MAEASSHLLVLAADSGGVAGHLLQSFASGKGEHAQYRQAMKYERTLPAQRIANGSKITKVVGTRRDVNIEDTILV